MPTRDIQKSASYFDPFKPSKIAIKYSWDEAIKEKVKFIEKHLSKK